MLVFSLIKNKKWTVFETCKTRPLKRNIDTYELRFQFNWFCFWRLKWRKHKIMGMSDSMPNFYRTLIEFSMARSFYVLLMMLECDEINHFTHLTNWLLYLSFSEVYQPVSSQVSKHDSHRDKSILNILLDFDRHVVVFCFDYACQ